MENSNGGAHLNCQVGLIEHRLLRPQKLQSHLGEHESKLTDFHN